MGWDSIEYLAIYAHLEMSRAKEIELGQGDEPKMSELKKIADALYRTVEWLLSNEEPDDPPMLHCKDMCSGCRQDETTCKDA